MDAHIEWALEHARSAEQKGEVPVGAVVIRNGVVIGAGENQKECLKDPTAHAEIQAIRQACTATGDWRLNGAILVSTLEPCPMCAGAILQARLDEVVFGAKDLRWGAAGTVIDLLGKKQFNHQCKVTYAPHNECVAILKSFFKARREK